MNPSTLWNQADLHLHTTYSDGSATPKELLEHVAEQRTLRVIAVTDHDEIEGALEAQHLAPHYGVDVIVGEEISTAHGHLLGLFLQKRIEPGLGAEESIARIHEQGGLAIAPHPFDASVPSLGRRLDADALHALPLDGVESFNSSIFWPWRAANDTARDLAASMRIAVTGGSDAHALHAVGAGRTWFRGRSAADVFTAIRRGATRAEGEFLSVGSHTRQILGMVRNMGVGEFTRWIVHVAHTPAASPT